MLQGLPKLLDLHGQLQEQLQVPIVEVLLLPLAQDPPDGPAID
jgi:hypothetical protein